MRMSLTRICLVAGLTLTAAAGCASTAGKTSPPTFPQTATNSTSAASTGVTSTSAGPPPVRTGVLGSAQALGCASDLATVETAIQAFFAINSRYPNSEAELVSGGLIATESALHDIGPDGTIVPSPSSGCEH
jgi:hypothetical protein